VAPETDKPPVGSDWAGPEIAGFGVEKAPAAVGRTEVGLGGIDVGECLAAAGLVVPGASDGDFNAAGLLGRGSSVVGALCNAICGLVIPL
jgi:hypothetical protein